MNGSTDIDEAFDDSDYFPSDGLSSDQSRGSEWWDSWDNVADPDYVPEVHEVGAVVVQRRYDFRRRTDNPSRVAYVAPPCIHDLRNSKVPFRWTEDYLKEFAKAISLYGHKWTKICKEPSIGLPSNMKAHSLKEKWRSMDVDDSMWISSSDDSDEDFEDGEEYEGYAEYLMGPRQLNYFGGDEDKEACQNPFGKTSTTHDIKFEWGSRFEVGSSSNPPRKSPRLTPRLVNPSTILQQPSSAQPIPPNSSPIDPPPNPNHRGSVPPRPLPNPFPNVPRLPRTPRVVIPPPPPPPPPPEED